jgi:hypothetical protein
VTDTDVQAWCNTVTFPNTNPSELAILTTLVVNQKADGSWAKLDREWIYQLGTPAAAAVDLVTRSSHTLVGSPGFTPYFGIAGNGTSSYANTNYNPVTNGVHYTGPDASFGYWVRVPGAVTGTPVYMGNDSRGTPNSNFSRLNATQTSWAVNVGTGATNTVLNPPTGVGLQHGERTGASTGTFYHNGVSRGSSATTSTTPTSQPFFVLASNGGTGTPAFFSAATVSMAFTGSSMGPSIAASFYNDINTALNALGALGTNDPVTLAWAAAVVQQGGTVSGTHQTRVDTLVKSLKLTGVWPLIDWALPLAGENTQQAYTDLKYLLLATPVSGPTFTASQGVAGAVSTTYINTNFNPTTNLVAGSQNSFHASLYNRTNRTSGGNNSCNMGVSDGSFLKTIAFTLQPGTSPQANLFANQDALCGITQTPGTAQGYWIMGRNGAAGANCFAMRNGSALTFGTTNASTGLAAFPIFIGNLSRGGAPNASNGVADQHAFSTIGAALTTQNQTDLTSAVNAYMTSLGTNVF